MVDDGGSAAEIGGVRSECVACHLLEGVLQLEDDRFALAGDVVKMTVGEHG